MGYLGTVLGGALQGIGAGIVQQGQAKAETEAATAKETAAMRREVALENLRNQNAMSRDKSQSDLKVGEMKVGAQLDDWKSANQTKRTTGSQIAVDKARTQNDITITQLKARLDRDNSTAATQLKAQIDSGQIKDTVEGDDGNIYAIMADGTTKNTGIKFRPKPTAGGIGADAFPMATPGAAAPSGAAKPASRPPLSSFEG